jgi:hypothetical protein
MCPGSVSGWVRSYKAHPHTNTYTHKEEITIFFYILESEVITRSSGKN